MRPLPIDSYDESPANSVQNYDTAYYHNVTDNMFLLYIKQLNKVYQNSSILGNYYYMRKVTQKAVDNSDYKSAGMDTSLYTYNWTRTPSGYNDRCHTVRVIGSGGKISVQAASSFYFGVRPAFYIDLSTAIFSSGNGSVDVPYIVDATSNATPTT